MTKALSLLAVLGTVTLAACQSAAGEEPAPARPVRIEHADAMPGPSRLRYSTAIQADAEVPVAFKVGGYVATILQRRGADGRMRPLQPGDHVRAGETLARVRDDDYRERMRQAQGTIAELHATNEKARLDLERARALYDAESLTRPELDAAIANVNAGKARVESARAQLALAEIALGDGLLQTPVSGVVLERRIEIGALVGSGAVGFVVGQLTPVKAVFGVPDLHVVRMQTGSGLAVTTEAFPGQAFDGTITSIAPAADPQNRLFRVEVSIANADGRLRPGMIAVTQMTQDSQPAQMPQSGEAAVAIPLAAVVRAEGTEGYSVFVANGSGEERVARARRVALGEVRGNAVAVTNGLVSGEAVIVTGPGMLVDGERVRVIP
jgi:RND family efflux transporter MFP subunit